MFMISKEAMDDVLSLREKLAEPGGKVDCIAHVQRMIETKESILARAEWGSCCGNVRSLAPRLEHEIQMLHSILSLLEEGDPRAATVLDDYIILMQEGYTPEPDHW